MKKIKLKLITITVTTAMSGIAVFVWPQTYARAGIGEIFKYFNKVFYLTTKQLSQTNNDQGIISWLPGEEFIVLLKPLRQDQEKNNDQPEQNVPLDNTPEFIKENIKRKIADLQKPTEEEKQKTVEAELVYHNLPIAVLNVWRPKVKIQIRNLTNKNWYRDETFLLSEDTNGNVSFFRDPTWINTRIITAMQENEVRPGEVATFEFLIDGRGKPFLYYHVYKLQVDGKILHFTPRGALHWLTRVDPYTPY